MEELSKFEENIKNSFSYVKKDLIKVNEQINHLHEKIQHLSLNNASLLGEMQRLESEIARLRMQKPAKASVKSTKKGAAKSVKDKAKRKVVKETITYS